MVLWAQNIGGRTALQYLIKVEGMEFLDAALYLKDLIDKQPPTKVIQSNKSSYHFASPIATKMTTRLSAILSMNESSIRA